LFQAKHAAESRAAETPEATKVRLEEKVSIDSRHYFTTYFNDQQLHSYSHVIRVNYFVQAKHAAESRAAETPEDTKVRLEEKVSIDSRHYFTTYFQ